MGARSRGQGFRRAKSNSCSRSQTRNCRCTSHDWLVCGGPKCQFKGHGTVNGVGGYSFLLSAIDGQLPGGGGQDKLRMKIWIPLTEQVVYDNQWGSDEFADRTTVIGGGSIAIHKG